MQSLDERPCRLQLQQGKHVLSYRLNHWLTVIILYISHWQRAAALQKSAASRLVETPCPAKAGSNAVKMVSQDVQRLNTQPERQALVPMQ